MKIAIVGATNTGKTLLAKYLAKKFNLYYIEDKNINKLKPEALKQVVEYSIDDENIVTDFTGINLLALTYLNNKKLLTEEFIQACYSSLKKYTHIIYIPLEFLDSSLKENKETLAYDKSLRKFLDSFNYITITGSQLEREKKVTDYINCKDFKSRYLVFEGLPGASKSYLINKLKQEYGEKIYICKRFSKNSMNIILKSHKTKDDKASNLLVEKYIEEYNLNEVEKRLKEGKIVIADRGKFTVFIISMILGVDISKIYFLTNKLPLGNIIYFDFMPKVSYILRKYIKKADKPNPLKETLIYPQKSWELYNYLISHHYECKKIDATKSRDFTYTQLKKHIEELIGEDNDK